MAGTLTKTVVLEIRATSEDAQRKIDDIAAKAEALKRLNPQIAVKIDTAAAAAKMRILRDEIKAAGKDAGQSAGSGLMSGIASGMSGSTGLIAAGVGVALAALPAAAAATGAAAGIALGAKLLIGTQQVKGPLYAQWQGMLQTLTSVARLAALPLLQPLRDAFAQIGTWAKALYPELKAVFGSLGPMVMPLAKGLEGLASGVLPGFLTLMKSALPAVQAVSGVLSGLGRSLGGLFAQMAPAVRASASILTSLGNTVRAVAPLIGTLANSLAAVLAPILRVLSGSILPAVVTAIRGVIGPVAALAANLLNGLAPVIPPLVRAFSQVAGALTGALGSAIKSVLPSLNGIIGTLTKLFAQVIVPYLPVISKLASTFVQVNMLGVAPLVPPILALADKLLQLGASVIQPLIPLLQGLANALLTVANTVDYMLSKLSALAPIPGLGFLAGLGGGGAGGIGGGLGAMVLQTLQASMPTGSQAYNAAVAALSPVLDAWGDGLSGTGTGVKTKVKAKAANLGLILATGVQQGLAGTAAQVRTEIAKLLGAVRTDVAGQFISEREGTALTRFLERDSQRLQTLASRRAHILAVIQAADKYAANIAQSTQSSFGLVNAAAVGTGPWGGPASVGSIIGTLQSEVRRIRSFARDIAKLRKMGLNRAYIDQLIAAGPDQGGAIADELASSGIGEIRQINAAEHQIASASVSLGRTAAEAMFDSGKQAGKGFLSGLEAQQKQIEAVMKKIAQVLVDTIKRELKMHSPSQVMRDLGAGIPAGLKLGIDDGHALLTSAAARMARATVPAHIGAMAGAGHGTPLRIELVWTGGPADAALITLLKNHVRIRGGDPGIFGR